MENTREQYDVNGAEPQEVTMPEHEELTLSNLANGAAEELFQYEVAKLLENIADPNTPADVKRTITLTVEFKPAISREESTTVVKVKSKLAPVLGAASTTFFGIKQGQRVAVQTNPKQVQFDFDREPVEPPHAVENGGGE